MLVIAFSLLLAGDLSYRPPGDVAGVEAVVLSELDRELIVALADHPLDANQWQQFFPVYFGVAPIPAGQPAMLGRWSIERERIEFRPRFPFKQGRGHVAVVYLAELRAELGLSPGGPARLELSFEGAMGEELPVARVLSVSPAGGQVPSNLLRMYLTFSQPMRQGLAYQYILVRDDQGDVLDAPFVIVPQELWDRSGTRLTLLFDPGRIKRGLSPNLSAGAPLAGIERFTLEVQAERPDALGRPLGAVFRQDFEVGPADRERPDPRSWQVREPAVGSLEPLVILMEERLDRELALRLIQLRSVSGEALPHRLEITADSRELRFYPEQPWIAGSLLLAVHPDLEDLAGNRIYRLFDEEMTEEHTDKRQPIEQKIVIGDRKKRAMGGN